MGNKIKEIMAKMSDISIEEISEDSSAHSISSLAS